MFLTERTRRKLESLIGTFILPLRGSSTYSTQQLDWTIFVFHLEIGSKRCLEI
jgi:hypothetical protein